MASVSRSRVRESNTTSRCLPSREKLSPEDQKVKRNKSSEKHFEHKIERDIREFLPGSTDSLSYANLVKTLSSLNFISENMKNSSSAELDLVTDLWKLLGGDLHGTINKGQLIKYLLKIVNSRSPQETAAKCEQGTEDIAQKFELFRVNRLSKKTNEEKRHVRGETSACDVGFSFSPKLCENSRKYALVAKQKVIREGKSRERARSSNMGQNLSTPDLLFLRQTLQEEYNRRINQ